MALCGLLTASSLLTAQVSSPALDSKAAQAPPDPPSGLLVTTKSRIDEVLQLVNKERAARRLPPLRRVPELDQAAEKRARDMADRDYFAHVSPDGVTPGDQVIAAGYRPLMCGENIASGYANAASVMRAWMDSPGHRANILERRFRDIGLSFLEAPGTDSGVLWVQEFGEPSPERPTVQRAAR
jgi:uncharacterized protein YkwD